jgi:hypothetical protein
MGYVWHRITPPVISSGCGQNVLLARYFNARGLFHDLDFVGMKEGKPDKLFTAWRALPDA